MNASPDALRALLVDDDRVLSLYHKAVLEAAGFAVRHVARPSEALANLAEVAPDLVIVDYHLPEMTGSELAAQIRQSVHGERIGILLITADEHPQTLANAIRHGVSSYLIKPLDQELFPIVCHSLASNARRILENTRHLQELLNEQERLKESLLAAKEAAENASRFKSEFLASMSHELRTPLNSILGFAQLFSLEPHLPEDVQGYAKSIENAGQHLLSLVNDLIDLARIEAGKLEISIEPVPLRKVIADSLNMVAPIAAKYRINLAEINSSSLQSTVRADYVRLRQVLINLLSNAIKYNRPEGYVRLTCETANGRERIAISDNGPGIPAAKQARLFNAFDRLGAERGSVEGTGIGLVITQRIVEAMGGKIGFSSREGEGTTFWVEFPQAEQTTTSTNVGTAPTPTVTSATQNTHPMVLYVEDNPMNLRLMRQVFATRKDLRLREAQTAEEGIDMARQEPPALILMDINLPGMNGYEALSVLRGNPRTATIPVIAVSANAMKGDMERGLKTGFAAYLTKPINIPALLTAVDQALRGKTR